MSSTATAVEFIHKINKYNFCWPSLLQINSHTEYSCRMLFGSTSYSPGSAILDIFSFFFTFELYVAITYSSEALGFLFCQCTKSR